MNAYLIQEDSDYVIVAFSMQQAIENAETLAIRERSEDTQNDGVEYTMQMELSDREDFRSLMQSCSLVGEVRSLDIKEN